MSTWVWATVTSLQPMRVQIDGDTAPLPIDPQTLVDPSTLVLGGRVRCELTDRSIIVHGAHAGDTAPPDFGLVRSTVAWSTRILATFAQETGLVTLSSTWVMLGLQVNRPCRVRLYDTAAHRDADVTRPRGADPVTAANPGVLLDWAFQNSTPSPITMTPIIVGAAIPASASVPYTIDNLDAVSGVVTVTFTFITLQP